MSINIIKKIYDKENKLSVITQETDLLKIIYLYKYDKENKEIHSFIYQKKTKNLISKNFSFYEFIKISKENIIEKIWITDFQIEHWEINNDKEEKKYTKIFTTGNYYEERKKNVDGEVYITEFKNGSLSDFKFKLPRNKINEYLNKISYGK